VDWLKEPLLHFVLLGAALFAVDHFVSASAGDPRTIAVDEEVDKQAIDVFKGSRGREPNKDELRALRRVWLDNEVLYREGLALQLDKGDPAIRDRVIFKALSVVDASTKLPPYTDETLRDWFDKRRAKYDEPTRYTFQEAVLSKGATPAAVRDFVEALNAGKPPGDVQAGLRVFKDRPRANLEEGYGKEFVAAMDAGVTGKWEVLQSSSGVRAIQLESIAAAKPADYEDLRGVVLQDWTDETLAAQRSAAVEALTKKYKVVTAETVK
jgi:hypothetical protein